MFNERDAQKLVATHKEWAQRMARMLKDLESKPYKERLKKLSYVNVAKRRLKEDIFERDGEILFSCAIRSQI